MQAVEISERSNTSYNKNAIIASNFYSPC